MIHPPPDKAGRLHVSRLHLSALYIFSHVVRYADIIGLFVFGVVLVILFGLWQYYLERRLEYPNLPRTHWTAPPLMKPSMWANAHGRFAVMQIIACVNWAAFTCWLVWVQLYYQTYLNLTPIHTMIRILPMFFMGVVANIIIALIIGSVDVVYIVGTWSVPPLILGSIAQFYVHHVSTPLFIGSHRNAPDGMCEYLFRRN